MNKRHDIRTKNRPQEIFFCTVFMPETELSREWPLRSPFKPDQLVSLGRHISAVACKRVCVVFSSLFRQKFEQTMGSKGGSFFRFNVLANAGALMFQIGLNQAKCPAYGKYHPEMRNFSLEELRSSNDTPQRHGTWLFKSHF